MVLPPCEEPNYIIIPDAPAAPSPIAVVYHELLQLPDPPQRHPAAGADPIKHIGVHMYNQHSKIEVSMIHIYTCDYIKSEYR